MPDITVTISDAEMRALAYVAVDPVEWITNLVKTRAAAAADEIYQNEMVRMMADPSITMIPANRELVVAAANIRSAAERQAEFLANPPVVAPPEGT